MDRFPWIVAFSYHMTNLKAADFQRNTIAEPDFISEWTSITAGLDDFNPCIIYHPLEQVPALVDVQVMSEEEPNHGFIFQAMGSAHTDEDHRGNFGGVIYIYDAKAVYLYFPDRRADTGYVINTGSSSYWMGPNEQALMTAKARIRLWMMTSLPSPDFHEDTYILKSKSDTNSFVTVQHGLSETPVFVQVRSVITEGKYKGNYTDAQGSLSLEVYGHIDWGAVIYAYNSSSVRVWAPNEESTNDCALFSNLDGWRNPEFNNPDATESRLYISAWSSFFPKADTVASFMHTEKLPLSLFDVSYTFTPTETIYAKLTVECLDGPNVHYQFPGGISGAVDVKNSRTDYGGVVFAYCNTSLRFWIPLNGYGIYVPDFLGDSYYMQLSKNYIIHVSVYSLAGSSSSDTTASTFSSVVVSTMSTINSSNAAQGFSFTTVSAKSSSSSSTYATAPSAVDSTSLSMRLSTSSPHNVHSSFKTDSPKCFCAYKDIYSVTTESMVDQTERLTSELTVEKKETSSFVRSKRSAVNTQSSAKYVGGTVATVFLVITFFFILLSDVMRIVNWLVQKFNSNVLKV